MARTFALGLVTTIVLMELARAETADLIYTNGEIPTMDGVEPNYADAVETRDGKNVFVGGESEPAQRFPKALRKDLRGNTMLADFVIL